MCKMVAFACIVLLFSSLQVVSSFTSHYSRSRRIDIQQQKRINVECFQTSDATSDDSDNYFHHLLSQFQGDFDNYHQVIRDRNHALAPADGGGHEHIHCTLVPCPHTAVTQEQRQNNDQWILAAFYFNGNPRQIFRFRMYKLISPQDDDSNSNNIDGEKVRMKLHTLSSELEQQLRQYSDQPCTWWRETYDVWLNSINEGENESDDNRSNEWNTFRSEGIQHLVSPLVGCDVLWDPQWDPKKHAYLNVDEYGNDTSSSPTTINKNNNVDGCHATMEAGSAGAIVDSISLIPGKRILIKDELSLWEDEFWINDRGYDPDAVVDDNDGGGNDENEDGVGNMPFVYGNRRGVPYKLERVSCISTENTNEGSDDMSSAPPLLLERTIHKQELAWTLGDDFREQTEYEEKLRAVEEALLQS
uniref:Uncharacterized protein n=1 Tax=Skeletonema marinoi TaxID=267567 RepID=A0A7S2PZJ6_9STRA|mmetsp:Transcript_5487/g.9160  ORF Transcript_5487/g.9160 Transcript_5487/m.9160 type:complete len:416 (+) Transcript_5487:54-1301(+)